MSSRLAEAGWTLTADIPRASVIVVHSCGFLEAARREARETVRSLRRASPRSFLVLSGCFAQYVGSKRPRGVDALLGTGEFHRLPELIARRGGETPNDSSRPGPAGYHDAARSRPLTSGQLSSYLRISEGCNHRCAFCIIPQLRGNLRSRPVDEVLTEARDLVGRGVRELCVISQDTTDYGGDLSPAVPLTGLIRRLLKIKDLRWLRLLYAYPSEVTEELIDLLAGEPALCGYLDMPLQHLSDRILRAMGRDGGRKDTLALLERLRRRVPHLALRTTFIVGFPGETESDFRRLLAAVREGYFEHVGVFPYSLEPRSASARLEDQVPAEVVNERWQRLLDAHGEQTERRAQARLGTEIQVLAERDPRGAWAVRAAHQAPEVDGGVLLAAEPPVPGFYRARVTGRQGLDLTAELSPRGRRR
jgi:ribosomal protein S12 methylthiotransferase